MSLIALLLISASILIIAYFTYGRFVSDKLKMTNKNVTPAHTHQDGIDYIPSKPVVVLGHHFSSIAGAGPILGPIIAVAFGWIPAVIWILFGGIFFGAVHDLTSMVASMRHEGKSIGGIIQKHIGYNGKILFLIFSFSTLILVIAVFTDVIAKTFVNNPGVASSSILFIFLAILFGKITNGRADKKGLFVISTIVGVLLMFYFVFLGVKIPLVVSYEVWVAVLLAYAFIASVTPVSFLLQPRDYLSSFLLYGLILFAVIGVFYANPQIKMDSDIKFNHEEFGYIFPALFVTIACGAISGFHSLVASGTSSKQVDKEKDAKIVGFGGMLIESFLAIIALGSVIVISRAEYANNIESIGPVSMFAGGLGKMISVTGVSADLAITFVALTVSAFALTTLDTCTRLARFTFQEFFEDVRHPTAVTLSQSRYLATTIPVVLSVLLLLSGGFSKLWAIFGSANQLLAALALLTVAVWLIKKKVNPNFVLIPMFFMFAVTLSSLFFLVVSNFNKEGWVLSIISGLLFILAIVLLVLAKNSLKKEITNSIKVPGSEKLEVH